MCQCPVSVCPEWMDTCPPWAGVGPSVVMILVLRAQCCFNPCIESSDSGGPCSDTSTRNMNREDAVSSGAPEPDVREGHCVVRNCKLIRMQINVTSILEC